MRKLTIEFVKEQFEEEGYILLTTIYENAHQKLRYVCPYGHKHCISWDKWQRGQRCPYCSKYRKRYDIDFVRECFENEGYILLTTIYKNNTQKLKYICPNNHKHSIIWAAWQNGHRCPYCAGVGKLTIKLIKDQFVKEGYILKTTIYENSRQKLEYICPKKHKHSISCDNWKTGYRCPYCAIEDTRLSIEYIKAVFEKEEYCLLTTNYKNTFQKLECICPNGHKYLTTWNTWRQNKRCPICYRLNCFAENTPNWKGGISCEPYCDVWLDKDFKESIKQRDGYKCMNPDCWGTTKRLAIHHIDYVKKNCNPNNLITLCNSCNTRANYDREWHTDWYRAIMQKRYNKKEI